MLPPSAVGSKIAEHMYLNVPGAITFVTIPLEGVNLTPLDLVMSILTLR